MAEASSRGRGSWKRDVTRLGASAVGSLLLLAGCGGTQAPSSLASSRAALSQQGASHRFPGAVATGHYNNFRSGANVEETTLTPDNVNAGRFGKVGELAVDGNVYTQPLYVPDVRMSDGDHNVVYVTTTHNSVYAFDADTRDQLWMVNLGPAVPTVQLSGPAPGQTFSGILPEEGITGTPAIDLSTGVMWLVAQNLEPDGSVMHRLHALRIDSGEEFGDPVEVTASAPGNGTSSVDGVQTMDQRRHVQRSAILLDHGQVYVAMGSHGDFAPWNGWLLAYSASADKQLMATFITAPDGEASGIWMGGNGPSADQQGNIYFSVGNGTYAGNPGFPAGRPQVGLGSSVTRVKFSGDHFDLVDWFIPFDVQRMDDTDADMGSGAVLAPDLGLVFAFHKGAKNYPAALYAVHQDNFGGFQANQADQVTETVTATDPDHTADPSGTLLHKLHGPPVHWAGPNGDRVYLWVSNDFLRAYAVDSSGITPMPVASGNVIAKSNPGTGMLAVSSSGTDNGIVWGNIKINESGVDHGILYAFDANTLQKLWSSRDNKARDDEGNWPKFAEPTVGGGKVFMATTSAKVDVYGLLH